MRRFYAPPEQFGDRHIDLGLDETRHLRDVLRLREGDEINVFDGEGREFLCKIEAIEKKSSRLAIILETDPVSPESDLELILALGLLKGEKFDLVVQKAVEIGVSRIQPLFTKRSDVKFAVKDSKTERWRKIALEAAKQSGRAKLTTVENPMEFENFAGSFHNSLIENEGRILFTERLGNDLSIVKNSKKITAIVGPEGGWEDSELNLAREHGFTLVTLGGRIMRAETAAIAATVILQHRFGDLR
ncbi:MAG: 16S rRNA (uracil(1498)-N(3))-methyltransferase [Saprospiraceae bacterium]|nr:16S rRNA (uracil(1498)-N(3))-methyltransferase [Pyrinomonadaceae bacterium]